MAFSIDGVASAITNFFQGARKVASVSAAGVFTFEGPLAQARWTTAGRPTGVPPGTTGFNTTNNKFEGFDGARWDDLDGGKTWVKWTYPGTITASANVASVVRTGGGNYRV